jgi:hypothetical protein
VEESNWTEEGRNAEDNRSRSEAFGLYSGSGQNTACPYWGFLFSLSFQKFTRKCLKLVLDRFLYVKLANSQSTINQSLKAV